MAFSYTLMLFPSGQESLSSVANPGASPLSSLAPAHLPWSHQQDPRLRADGDTAAATEPSCRAQGRAAAGRIQRHLQPAWGCCWTPPSQGKCCLPHPETHPGTKAGHSWQQLARTGDAVDGWQWVTPGAAQVRSRPAGLWVFLILRYLQTRA